MKKRKKKSQISKKRMRRIRQRNKRILLSTIVVTILAFVIMYAAMYKYVHETADTQVCDNIYIGPNKVSGMNEAEIKADLEQRLEEYGKVKIKLIVGEKSKKISLEKLGLSIANVDELARQAVTYGKEGSLWKRFKEIRELEEEKVVLEEEFVLGEDASETLDKKTASLERRAKNASIEHTGSGFSITEDKNGYQVMLEESLEKIVDYLNTEWNYEDGEVELVREVIEPKIKASQLESIRDTMGSYYTVAGGGTRLQNLKRAAQLISGTIVMPGEVISVEALTKPYTTDNGYVEGTAYENGEIVTSIGGGLCQVSSTLYNALLYAEVEMVERCAHSMQVNYVEPSRDAAIAEGLKDLQFKNNYDTPILIEGYVDGNNYLRFYVYGKETRPESRSVEYISEVLEKKEYRTKYVADDEHEIGSMIKEGSGIDGMVAKLWKVTYKNGEEVDRKTMNNSTYNASTVTVKVGVASDNREAANLVKEAISSQKKNKIEEAISKAKQLEKNAASEKDKSEENEEE